MLLHGDRIHIVLEIDRLNVFIDTEFGVVDNVEELALGSNTST